MAYPENKPSGDYILRDYDFGVSDDKKTPMDEFLFKYGYRNAEESKTESVPDAHNENWFYDMIHQNLRYALGVAEENKNLLENKIATPTTIGQVKIGYGLQVTPSGVLSVVKSVAENASVISYDLPVGSFMFWCGKNMPEYFIEPIGQTLDRNTFVDLWNFAQSNDLVSDTNEYQDGKIFGIGDGSTTFKVFDLRGKFIKSSEENKTGFYEEAGLPNITGEFAVSRCTKDFGTGAFKKTKNSGYYSNYGNAEDGGRYNFDASRSSEIYGKSTTVTPENIALKLILKAKPTPPSKTVPTGTILDYTGSVAPIGYIIANGAELNRNDFSELFSWAVANNLLIEQSQIPSTAHGFYGTGNGSTTFTIPDMRGVFKRSADLVASRGGSQLGEYQDDGLPNIQGTLSGGAFNGSGAFYKKNTNKSGSGDYDTYNMIFDASRSNPIYGNATQVQPKSVAITPILKY